LKIVSINIGSPELVSIGAGPKKHNSGIFKKPISGSVRLGEFGFNGDGVGDTRIHGGADKAVCAYCVEHFSHWNQMLGREIFPGSFGENLSLSGMPETLVNIGDIYDLGSAQIQVTQPRQPCHKLNKVFNEPGIACSVKKTGFSGYYFRVLKVGEVESGSTLKRVREDFNKFSIEKANALLRKGGSDIQAMEELISIQSLSDEWREMIQMRLNRLTAPKG
jgi:MOSC domain-containing protein YiiM